MRSDARIGIDGLESELSGRRPKIVVIGGGTGSSVTLRGLKDQGVDITAIVTAFDSGGSSGKLRDEFGYLPLGDLRQCIVALSDDAEDVDSLRSASEFRFSADSSLNGHNLGNLLLAALTAMHDDIETGIRVMSRMLRVRGQVIPVALDPADLCAELEDGSVLRGESTIDLRRSDLPAIRNVFLDPVVKANPRALDAISEADAIVLGPGDLFTSIVPNLLVRGVPEAIRASGASTIYSCNLMTKHGETDDFTASDFVAQVSQYLGSKIDWAITNSRPIPLNTQKLYASEGAAPVTVDDDEVGKYARRHMSVLLSQSGEMVRHDAHRLAEAILSALEEPGAAAGFGGMALPLSAAD